MLRAANLITSSLSEAVFLMVCKSRMAAHAIQVEQIIEVDHKRVPPPSARHGLGSRVTSPPAPKAPLFSPLHGNCQQPPCGCPATGDKCIRPQTPLLQKGQFYEDVGVRRCQILVSTLALATEHRERSKQPNDTFPSLLVIAPLNDGSMGRVAGADALGPGPDKPDIKKWRRQYHLLDVLERTLTSRFFAKGFNKELQPPKALRRHPH